MSEEIVRRLRNKKNPDFIKESLQNHRLSEADEDDEDSEDMEIPEYEESEEEVGAGGERPPSRRMTLPSEDSEDIPDDEEYVDPDGEVEDKTSDDEDTNEYINPLDNIYAVQHTIGDEVLISYANGTNSKLKGVIDGYDKVGFYRIRWANGLTTNGITDLALSDLVSKTYENKCVCGSSKFVNEGKYTVCDKCGRRIREATDPLTLADKSRPKNKKLIRSEANPVSTVLKPPVSESIRKAFKSSIKESNEEDIAFYRLKELDGVFWTRLSELKEDIEELGYTVDEYNAEYVIVSTTDDEDEEYVLKIPIIGTSRTIALDLDKAKKL